MFILKRFPVNHDCCLFLNFSVWFSGLDERKSILQGTNWNVIDYILLSSKIKLGLKCDRKKVFCDENVFMWKLYLVHVKPLSWYLPYLFGLDTHTISINFILKVIKTFYLLLLYFYFMFVLKPYEVVINNRHFPISYHTKL